MNQCGEYQWWKGESRLTLQRERGPGRFLNGGIGLLVTGVLAFFLLKAGDLEALLGGTLALVLMLGFCIDQFLGIRQIILHRDTRRVSWAWGLGVPLFRRMRLLEAFDRVQLSTSASRSERNTTSSVLLHGPGESLTLASTDDDDEALELARAVAHHTGLGLQVDGGRVRPLEETPSPPVTDHSPPSCRILAREAGGRLVLEGPAPGWRPYVAQALSSFVLLAAGLVGIWMSFYVWRVRGELGQSLVLALLVLALPGMGFVLLRRLLKVVHTSWRLAVSRQGVEVTLTGWETPRTTRIAAHLLRDIDVREISRDATDGGLSEKRARPLLVIDREGADPCLLGEGLSRAELEWAAGRVHKTLAEMLEAQRQERPRAG